MEEMSFSLTQQRHLQVRFSSHQARNFLLATAKEFSNDIGMTFGLEKCSKVSFCRGPIQRKTGIKIDINTTIRELEPGKLTKI